jgi:hypothetical protein
MRNDARPVGEQSPASPVGGDAEPATGHADNRDSVAHDRQSRIVNRDAEESQPGEPDDPTMPSNDATLNTRI